MLRQMSLLRPPLPHTGDGGPSALVEKNRFDAKSPFEWMQGLRDYMAGRTEEMDALLTWVEQQEDFIDDTNLGHSAPLVDNAPNVRDVSRQLWAMLSPLLKDST